jgi:rSAM/selenodomain-associated transferase 2
MKISVIIPVLNERECLPENLAALKLQNWIHEIIVVDGGSTDGTLALLRRQCDVKLIESPAGRGIQLNAGARAATGDILVFLHADSSLPPNAGEQLKGALVSSPVVGGCFYVRFNSPRPRSLGIVAAGINLRTVLTSSATGDQAIFVRQNVFEKIGGFRDWPLFEDVDFVSRIKRVGKFTVIRSPVTASARRHVHYGVYRMVILVYLLRLGFWAGISPSTLAKWYQPASIPLKLTRALRAMAEHNVISG